MQLEPLLLDEMVSAFGPERVVAPLNVIREVACAGATLLIATHELGSPRSSRALSASYMRASCSSRDAPAR
ncbi:MAG: hypothetical protein ACLQBX_01555, partial [Candidatus Limnocylindrales bacterium]|jgi:ABC-type polar amino acid transport system ATPase subunit